MTVGIYKFENLVNGHIYIGQSINIEQRYLDHLKRARNKGIYNHEYNSPLHRAIRKYGIDNFDFSIIEHCEITELDQREIFWISYYNSYENGYNLTRGGGHQDATVKFDLDTIIAIQNLLINSTKTYDEIHQLYNISLGRISEINTGKAWYNPEMSYPLRPRKSATIYICPKCGKQKLTQKGKLCMECFARASRKVQERPTKEELLAKLQNSSFVAVGKEYGVSDNTIRKWCKSHGLPTHAKEIKEYKL